MNGRCDDAYPKTDVTLFLDEGEVTETSMTFRCEILEPLP